MPSQPKTQSGGSGEDSQDLLDFIIDNGRNVTERDVRPLAQQLARTLSLIHAHGVVHRNLKLESVHLRVNPTGARDNLFSFASLSAKKRRPRRHRRRDWQATLTDWKYAATFTAPDSDSATVRVPTTSGLSAPKLPPLVALCGEQYSPAPELLQSGIGGAHTPRRGASGASATGSESEPPPAGAHAQLPPPSPLAPTPYSGYAGPPVDVWGLGVVLFTLVCRRIPFDGPTLHAMREASLRSPASLSFPRRVSKGASCHAALLAARLGLLPPCCIHAFSHASHTPSSPPPSPLPPNSYFVSRKDCRDLLRRMLHADPIARASLDEVLGHPWMEPASKRPNQNTLSAGVVDVTMHSHAELRWPDKVDRETFNRIAALESRNGDDAWKGLADALGLVSSRLCEARTGSGGGGVDSPGHLPELTSASNVGRFARGLREFPDRVWSLLAKVRSCAVLEWFTLTHSGPSWTFDDAAPWKAVDYLDSKQPQRPRPCWWMMCGYHQTKALRKSAERFVNISDKG